MDYNIYIHTVANQSDNASPTTPWAFRGFEGDDSFGGTTNGGGFSPSGALAVRKGAAFLNNPDSIVGKVMASGWGKLGIAAIIISECVKIADKVLTMYQSYSSPASGDYKFQIQYNNFKNALHNATRPFSVEVQRQINELEERKQRLANEQRQLLLGETFLNTPYGRYL